MSDKAQAISMLQLELKRCEEFLSELDEEQISEINIFDNHTTKDIVAHLAAWQQVTMGRLEAALNNHDPEFPGWFNGVDPQNKTDLDQMNSWIHGISHSHPWIIIHKEWRQRYTRIIQISEAIPESEMLEIGRYAWLKEYALINVLLGSAEHHKEHLDEIVAFFNLEDGL